MPRIVVARIVLPCGVDVVVLGRSVPRRGVRAVAGAIGAIGTDKGITG